MKILKLFYDFNYKTNSAKLINLNLENNEDKNIYYEVTSFSDIIKDYGKFELKKIADSIKNKIRFICEKLNNSFYKNKKNYEKIILELKNNLEFQNNEESLSNIIQILSEILKNELAFKHDVDEHRSEIFAKGGSPQTTSSERKYPIASLMKDQNGDIYLFFESNLTAKLYFEKGSYTYKKQLAEGYADYSLDENLLKKFQSLLPNRQEVKSAEIQ